MKKLSALIAVIMIVCMSLSAVSETLKDIASELVGDVHELAGDDEYFRNTAGMFYSSHDYIDKFTADDSQIKKAYLVKIPALGLITVLAGGAKMSEPGKEKLKRGVYDSIGSRWNDQKSSYALTQSTIFTWSRTYLAPEGFSDCGWIVECEESACYISFVETGNGIITATVTPMFLDAGESVEDIKKSVRQSIPAVMIFEVDV